jgi:hypothetical protein
MSDPEPKLNPNRAPNGGKGRPKGAKNRLTQCAKAAFEYAFEEIGGGKALADWANDNQGDFYKLYARCIPLDVNASVTLPKGIKVEFVEK